MTELLAEYLKLQEKQFDVYVKSIIKMLDKYYDMKDDCVPVQAKQILGVMKSSLLSQTVEDIKQDLLTGNVTMNTINKRVQLDKDIAGMAIDKFCPNPAAKVFLEFRLNNYVASMRNGIVFQLRMLGVNL